MSFLSKLFPKGFNFKITLPWFGEKNLGRPGPKNVKVTSKEIMDDIIPERRNDHGAR